MGSPNKTYKLNVIVNLCLFRKNFVEFSTSNFIAYHFGIGER
jgi:hypothetical protein